MKDVYYIKIPKKVIGFNNWLKKGNLGLIVCILIFGYLILNIIAPYMIYNKLTDWDITGLYFSAWYEKEYLFPDPIGWNPFFFLGYPQHQFYPPIFAYIVATLGFVIPLFWSFKTIFSITIIMLPVSFYYCARAFGFSHNKSAVTMALMFSILFIFPNNHYGGNMHATFNIGLITHALGMALFFFYLGVLHKNKESSNLLVPSLILSVIILTHIIAAFAAIFLIISYLLSRSFDKKAILWYLKHVGLAFLISSFWIVPFILKIYWLNSSPIGSTNSPLIYLAAFAFLLIILFNKREDLLPLTLFITLVIFFSFIATYFILIPIHLYRFTIYLYEAMILLIVSLYKKESVIILILGFLLAQGIILFSSPINPEGSLDMQLTTNLSLESNGRTMIVSPITEQTSPHVLKHQITMQQKVHSLEGLYVESAKNARFVFDINHEMRTNGMIVWGTYIDKEKINRNRTEVNKFILPSQLNLFGVSNIIIPKENLLNMTKSEDLVYFSKKDDAIDKIFEYELYLLNNSPLIEILNYTPKYIPEELNWSTEVTNWFLSINITKGILVNENVPPYNGTGKEILIIEKINPRQDYIKVKIENSTHPIPVLIKISQFPNWKAYEDGKPLKIYRASPYLMLVYSQKGFELKYENTWGDSIGNYLSILGVAIILFLALKPRVARPPESFINHPKEVLP